MGAFHLCSVVSASTFTMTAWKTAASQSAHQSLLWAQILCSFTGCSLPFLLLILVLPQLTLHSPQPTLLLPTPSPSSTPGAPPLLLVQLNCNQSTTGQDVIRLTALQIDKARRQKGKPGPALTEKNLSDFYMTVVCGDQESVVEEKLCVDDMHQRWPNCRFFLHRHSEDSFVTEHGPCTSV